MSSTLTLKLIHAGSTRRRTVDPTFAVAELHALLDASFGPTPRSAARKITYKDDEGDVCTIATEADLAEALRLAPSFQPPTLRLEVTLVDDSKKSGSTTREAVYPTIPKLTGAATPKPAATVHPAIPTVAAASAPRPPTKKSAAHNKSGANTNKDATTNKNKDARARGNGVGNGFGGFGADLPFLPFLSVGNVHRFQGWGPSCNPPPKKTTTKSSPAAAPPMASCRPAAAAGCGARRGGMGCCAFPVVLFMLMIFGWPLLFSVGIPLLVACSVAKLAAAVMANNAGADANSGCCVVPMVMMMMPAFLGLLFLCRCPLCALFVVGSVAMVKGAFCSSSSCSSSSCSSSPPASSSASSNSDGRNDTPRPTAARAVPTTPTPTPSAPPAPITTGASSGASEAKWAAQLEALVHLGYDDKPLLCALLESTGGDLRRVARTLLGAHDSAQQQQ